MKWSEEREFISGSSNQTLVSRASALQTNTSLFEASTFISHCVAEGTSVVASGVCGVRFRTKSYPSFFKLVAKWLEVHNDLVASHNQTYSLGQYHNKRHKGKSISDVVSW